MMHFSWANCVWSCFRSVP